MKLDFLKTTPKEALETITGLIESGYDLLRKLKQEHDVLPKPISEETGSKWTKELNAWANQVYIHLSETYESRVFAERFLRHSGLAYSNGNDPKLTECEVAIKNRVELLHDYYEFIIQHSSPSIHADGNIYLQIGDENRMGGSNDK